MDCPRGEIHCTCYSGLIGSLLWTAPGGRYIVLVMIVWLVHCYGLPQGRDTLYLFWFDWFTAMDCPSGEIHCTCYDSLIGSLLWTAPGVRYIVLVMVWLVHCYGLPQGWDTLYLLWWLDWFTAMDCPSGEIHCTCYGLIGSLLWTAPGVRYIVLVMMVRLVHCYGLPQGWDTLYLIWWFDWFTAMDCPRGEIHCTYDGLIGSLLWTAPVVRYIVLMIVWLVHCYGLPQGRDTLYLLW